MQIPGIMEMIICRMVIILVVSISIKTASGQSLNMLQSESVLHAVDISSSQAMGYEFLGMGTASIIYSGAGISRTKLPNAGYDGGGVMAITGVMFLIFGDRNPGIKYWKGYDGFRYNYPYNGQDSFGDKSLFSPESGIMRYYKELKKIKN